MGTRVRIESIAEARRDEALTAMRASRRFHGGWITPAIDDTGYDHWLERQATDEFEGFFIVRSSDGALAGMCNLSQIIRGPLQQAFMGFGAVAGMEGQGYMTEGVGLVLSRAFGPLKLHRVESNVQPGNHASRALLERLGFESEGYAKRYLKVGGRWRDHERWAMLAESWKGRKR
jgi:[ribosomal protein S5]-alanine N-acetyltransferase